MYRYRYVGCCGYKSRLGGIVFVAFLSCLLLFYWLPHDKRAVKPPSFTKTAIYTTKQQNNQTSYQNYTPKQPYFVLTKQQKQHPYFLSPLPRISTSRRRNSFDLSDLNPSKFSTVRKLIVFYNMPPWHQTSEYTPSLRYCPIKSCDFTDNKEFSQKADGIVFYDRKMKLGKPRERRSNQIWVFFANAPPWNVPHWYNLFNWTMTYRMDSDIVCPLFLLLPKLEADTRDFLSITKTKSSIALWLVSHCGVPSKRDQYVREVQKYTTVDIYGDCGNLNCPRSGRENCDHLANVKYKFYLAFENSICKDYVTEKLFRTYSQDIVAVVRGGANYEKFLPPNTYIDTAHFSSPKHLAEHLNYLDGNDTAYAEILERKSQYKVSTTNAVFESAMCDLCIKLHDPIRFSNSYSSINSWWYASSCSEPDDI